jgi:hypothetical protein
MHLFGRSGGPHMAHFHCVHSGDEVNGWWEVRDCEGLKWRVLRSGQRFAESAATSADSSQTLVVEGDATHFSDAVTGLGRCFYTVFSQEDGKGWERQVAVRINVHEHLLWHHPDAENAVDIEVDREVNPLPNPLGFQPVPSAAVSTALRSTIRQDGVAEWLHAES